MDLKLIDYFTPEIEQLIVKDIYSALNKDNINNLAAEVVIAASGQVKLEQLDSCLSLCDRDFIVFDR